MKASELIEELNKAIEKFGDLEVYSEVDYNIVGEVDLDLLVDGSITGYEDLKDKKLICLRN